MSTAGSRSNHRKPSPGPARRRRAARKTSSLRDGLPLNFTIPSDFTAELRDVQKRILDRVENCRFDSQSIFAIKLALEEALINAIKHGNKLDPRKKVTVAAKVTPRRCEIQIEDQGPGFRRSGVPDPTADENLLKCSGRGILLMEAYMDKVDWSRGGRRVKMIKRNEE
jgi:serine/threonine-protein kinase RsbW